MFFLLQTSFLNLSKSYASNIVLNMHVHCIMITINSLNHVVNNRDNFNSLSYWTFPVQVTCLSGNKWGMIWQIVGEGA